MTLNMIGTVHVMLWKVTMERIFVTRGWGSITLNRIKMDINGTITRGRMALWWRMSHRTERGCCECGWMLQGDSGRSREGWR